ncbi:MAG: zinc ribbon domain-containing protein, partial [Candidatus Rokubacteria bacterium]|nr:zinc ribbon domain-containing protein [Candidatus Rokubacteria bacterium]
MHCPRCRHESPPSSRFCTECGARLVLVCAGCGAELAEGVRFCGQCGLSVEAQRAGQTRFASPEAYTPRHLAEKIRTSVMGRDLDDAFAA